VQVLGKARGQVDEVADTFTERLRTQNMVESDMEYDVDESLSVS
jgi:hypothetical protein